MRSGLFGNRNFLLLWVGQAVSNLGDALRRITITLWLYEASGHSAVALAAVTVAEVTPTLLLSPVAGVFADRFDKRAIMVYADLARAILSLVQVLAVVTGQFSLTYIVTALAASAAAFFDPARGSLIPMIVPEKDLQQANGITTVTQQAVLIIGPAIGAVLYTTLGPRASFMLDSLSYFCSAATLALLSRVGVARGHGLTPGQFGQDLVSGLRYLRTNTLILMSFIISAGIYFSAGLNNTAMLFFIAQGFGRKPADITWLIMANGIAQLLTGSSLILLARVVRPSQVLLLTTLTMALGGMVIASAHAFAVLIAGVVITSLGNAPFNIARTTIEQLYVDPIFLGRIKATVGMAATIVFLIATGLSGLLTDALGARTVLIISAASMVLAATLTVAQLLPRLHKAECLDIRQREISA